MIRIAIGYDERESVAYHVCTESIISRTSKPVSFIPLALNALSGYHESHKDGSNAFIYSRFLVPYLCNYQGWAIFIDGDMVVLDDIDELWQLRDDKYAAMVVKHNYKTKFAEKYLGNKNEDYPCKNWSSVILWNCGHPSNRILTPEFVETAPGYVLHRFKHLASDEIGELPIIWNWLDLEFEKNDLAQLIHYTAGTPCFEEYADKGMANKWWNEFAKMTTPISTKRG